MVSAAAPHAAHRMLLSSLCFRLFVFLSVNVMIMYAWYVFVCMGVGWAVQGAEQSTATSICTASVHGVFGAWLLPGGSGVLDILFSATVASVGVGRPASTHGVTRTRRRTGCVCGGGGAEHELHCGGMHSSGCVLTPQALAQCYSA